MSEEEYTGNPEHQIPGMICWNELHSPDPEASKSFYSQLFDWRIEDMDMPTGTYTMFYCGKVPVAGVVKPTEPGIESSDWMQYVTVAKLEDALEKAKQLGATVLMEPTPLPNGRFAVISDPQNAQIGLYEYGDQPTG